MALLGLVQAINFSPFPDKLIRCYNCDSELIEGEHSNLRCISPLDGEVNEEMPNSICEGICFTQITVDENIYRACLTQDEVEYFYDLYHPYFQPTCGNDKVVCQQQAVKLLARNPDYSLKNTDPVTKISSEGASISFCSTDLCNAGKSTSLFEKFVMREVGMVKPRVKTVEVVDRDLRQSNVDRFPFSLSTLMIILAVACVVVVSIAFVIYRGMKRHRRLRGQAM